MEEREGVDRKTFFLGILLAAILILGGYYLMRRISRSLPSSARDAPSAPLEASPYVTDVRTDAEAVQALEKSGAPKVVLVHAPWCGHCRTMMADFLKAAERDTRAQWIRADGSIAPTLVRREDLRGFPTVYGVAADGSLTQHDGARDAASLLAFAKMVAGSAAGAASADVDADAEREAEVVPRVTHSVSFAADVEAEDAEAEAEEDSLLEEAHDEPLLEAA